VKDRLAATLPISPLRGLMARKAYPHLSILAACTGAQFSLRSIFVLVSARWLNIGTEAGVAVGFAAITILLIAASLAFAGHDARQRYEVFEVRAFQWVMLYVAFAGCSLFWSASASPQASVAYWSGIVLDVALVVMLLRVCGPELAAHSLMKGFIAGSFTVAVIAWLMPAGTDLRLGDPDYFNTNQIGNLCALSLLMCALLASRGDGRWRVTTLFLVATLFRSLSKSTIVAFIICEAYLLTRDIGMSRKRKSLVIASAAVLMLCFWGLFDAYYDVYSSEGNQAETLTGRTAIWAWTLDAALEHPWVGNGFDAMWKVAPPFGGDLFEARHAENELLQQFFAYGLCGIVLAGAIYASLYCGIRKLPLGTERSILTSFLIYVLVRGLAEAEPFDLLLPLWLTATLAFLVHDRRLELSDGHAVVAGMLGKGAIRNLPSEAR
jgi:exopolysaccharide production protein ExoQ